MSRSVGGAAIGAAAALSLTLAGTAVAEPGIHAPGVSTWDTRGSTVVLAFRPGFLSGGHFDVASYNANFTATSGNLSSQFGIHYINLRKAADEPVLHGVSATAVALFSVPTGSRFENGTPKAAVAFYLGAAPTVMLSTTESSLSAPLLLGLGAPWSPATAVTITPWMEFSPGLNLDTKIHSATFTSADLPPVTGNQATLTESQIRNIVSKTVTLDTSFTVGARAGLDVSFHLSDSAALNLNGSLGSLGTAFKGTTVGWIGAGLVFRWDDIVPAVLPAEKRLAGESCDAIEERHRACQVLQSAGVPPQSYPAQARPPYAPAQSQGFGAGAPVAPIQQAPAGAVPPPAANAPMPVSPQPRTPPAGAVPPSDPTIPTAGFPAH